MAGSTATTNGELLSYDGSDLPSVRLYYGDDIDFQLGWREAQLTGDTDSGISSSHTYTAAVNVGSASSITINGVSFSASGNNASTNSGTGWTITQGWGLMALTHGLEETQPTNPRWVEILVPCWTKGFAIPALAGIRKSK